MISQQVLKDGLLSLDSQTACSRADHGIGITETNEASFVDLRGGDTEYDFGYNAQTSNAPTQSYSLDLWIR